MARCHGPDALPLASSHIHFGTPIAGTVDELASASHEIAPAESSEMPTSTAGQQASKMQPELASTRLQGAIAAKDPANLVEAIHSLSRSWQMLHSMAAS